MKYRRQCVQVCAGHLVNIAVSAMTERPPHCGEQTSFKIMPRGKSRPCTTVFVPPVSDRHTHEGGHHSYAPTSSESSRRRKTSGLPFVIVVCVLTRHIPVVRKMNNSSFSFSFLPWTLQKFDATEPSSRNNKREDCHNVQICDQWLSIGISSVHPV